MNPDVGARWVAALRSGRYRQGTGSLTRFDAEGRPRHCCLGVLCEVALEAGVIANASVHRVASDVDLGGERSERCYDGQYNYLPPSVVAWAGLDDRDPLVVYGGRSVTLSSLNDDRQLSFAIIADLVEAQL